MGVPNFSEELLLLNPFIKKYKETLLNFYSPLVAAVARVLVHNFVFFFA